MPRVEILSSWISFGASEISGAGWLAMGLGVVATLALGIGLMALVFISSRHGYDEIGRRDGLRNLLSRNKINLNSCAWGEPVAT
jgi:hypothetical protein